MKEEFFTKIVNTSIIRDFFRSPKITISDFIEIISDPRIEKNLETACSCWVTNENCKKSTIEDILKAASTLHELPKLTFLLNYVKLSKTIDQTGLEIILNNTQNKNDKVRLIFYYLFNKKDVKNPLDNNNTLSQLHDEFTSNVLILDPETINLLASLPFSNIKKSFISSLKNGLVSIDQFVSCLTNLKNDNSNRLAALWIDENTQLVDIEKLLSINSSEDFRKTIFISYTNAFKAPPTDLEKFFSLFPDQSNAISNSYLYNSQKDPTEEVFEILKVKAKENSAVKESLIEYLTTKIPQANTSLNTCHLLFDLFYIDNDEFIKNISNIVVLQNLLPEHLELVLQKVEQTDLEKIVPALNEWLSKKSFYPAEFFTAISTQHNNALGYIIKTIANREIKGVFIRLGSILNAPSYLQSDLIEAWLKTNSIEKTTLEDIKQISHYNITANNKLFIFTAFLTRSQHNKISIQEFSTDILNRSFPVHHTELTEAFLDVNSLSIDSFRNDLMPIFDEDSDGRSKINAKYLAKTGLDTKSLDIEKTIWFSGGIAGALIAAALIGFAIATLFIPGLQLVALAAFALGSAQAVVTLGAAIAVGSAVVAGTASAGAFVAANRVDEAAVTNRKNNIKPDATVHGEIIAEIAHKLGRTHQ